MNQHPLRRFIKWWMLACLGCASPDRVEGLVTTDRGNYGQGARVELLVTNPEDTSMLVDHCSATLERDTGFSWAESHRDEICSLEEISAGPRGSVTVPVNIPCESAPGTFRYSIYVRWPSGDASGVLASSNSFLVERAPVACP